MPTGGSHFSSLGGFSLFLGLSGIVFSVGLGFSLGLTTLLAKTHVLPACVLDRDLVLKGGVTFAVCTLGLCSSVAVHYKLSQRIRNYKERSWGASAMTMRGFMDEVVLIMARIDIFTSAAYLIAVVLPEWWQGCGHLKIVSV